MSHYRAQSLSWKQRNHSEDLTRGVRAHFCVEITVEGNNTAEKDRGTGLATGRLPRAEISKLSLKCQIVNTSSLQTMWSIL